MIKDTLFIIVRNACIDQLRADDRRPVDYVEEFFSVPTDESTDDYDIQNEVLSKLYKVIESMPPRRREIFELRYRYGLERSDIVKRLGVKRSAVHEHLEKGHDQIEQAFNMAPNTLRSFLLFFSHVLFL